MTVNKLKTYHYLIAGSIFGLFMTIFFGFIFYMPLLRFAVKSQKALKPGNEMRDFYLKLPIPLDFRIYFFNVTNPLEVQDGGKPILQEVGPYCYDAFKEKIVVDENKENDTLTYNSYDTYFFNVSRSGDFGMDDVVTILNPLTVGIVNAVYDQKPQFIGAVGKALPAIFKDDYSIYLTAKVRNILFEGVKIDCNVKDFSAKAVCSQFKSQPAMREVEKNVYMFSIFGSRNGTNPQQITVYRGIKNGDRLGEVMLIDNKTDLQIWSENRCNKYQGTDGWIFPSFLKGNVNIVASDLCRKFEARFIEDIKFHGVKAKKYFADLGNDTCYCLKPGKCTPNGVLDMTKCLKVPLLCTLPHFLLADKTLLDQVEGLHPEIERHIIKIYFEPITGTPMLGQKRIQFNLLLQPIKKIDILKNITEVLHPILWLEEGVELEGYLLNKIVTVTTLLNLVSVGRFFGLIFCLQLLAFGCYQYYKEWKLSKVQPVDNSAEDDVKKLDRKRNIPNKVESKNN